MSHINIKDTIRFVVNVLRGVARVKFVSVESRWLGTRLSCFNAFVLVRNAQYDMHVDIDRSSVSRK